MIERISEIINQTVEDLGFEVVKIFIRGQETKIVEILIDKKDHSGTLVADCRRVSKAISALLDVEDVIPGKYFLEISSAGVERPLVKFDDYVRFKGRDIKLVLHNPVEERLKFKGKIAEAKDDVISLMSENDLLNFDFKNIKKANLLFTDDLFKELINKR